MLDRLKRFFALRIEGCAAFPWSGCSAKFAEFQAEQIRRRQSTKTQVVIDAIKNRTMTREQYYDLARFLREMPWRRKHGLFGIVDLKLESR